MSTLQPRQPSPLAFNGPVTAEGAASPHGLFLGLTTLDIIYLAETPLGRDEKQVAEDYQLCPGGPATNAAVTFAGLALAEPARSHRAQLAAAIGQHPLAEIVRADARRWQVELIDLAPTQQEPPSLSSILVNAPTGERSVISINARRHQAPADQLSAEREGSSSLATLLLKRASLILIDGHQMAMSAAIAPLAQAQNIPVIVDGGSWKPGFEAVLAATDYALCSAAFRPPGCGSEAEALAYLQALGVPHIAFTHGPGPITYWQQGSTVQPLQDLSPRRDRSGQIAIPQIQAVDTLGAGDIFHGAFCHYILERDFPQALAAAGAIASQACRSFGTRRWLEAYSAW